jgi:hypothetical protein
MGSPLEVSGYIVTLGAAAVPLPPAEALALGEEAELTAVAADEPTEAAADAVEVAPPIADETEDKAEVSCRGRSGVPTTPEMARKGRSW